jgi:hypothetical protein
MLVNCPECKGSTSAHYEDYGIGPFEFWGAKGYDTDTHYVTDCCEAIVDDQSPGEPDEPPDYDYRMDFN